MYVFIKVGLLSYLFDLDLVLMSKISTLYDMVLNFVKSDVTVMK